MSKLASTAIRLSDTQLIALSNAAQRDDGAIEIAEKLKGAVAQKFATTLIDKGLAREVRAKPGAPIVRRDAEGRAYSLVITKIGRTAVHSDEDDNALASTTNAGDRAGQGAPIGGSPAVRAKERSSQSARTSKKGKGVGAVPSGNRPREGSKLSAVFGLLAGANGASLDQIIAATEWLPHTTRAALTGLRKRGYVIERRRADGESRYKIAASEEAA